MGEYNGRRVFLFIRSFVGRFWCNSVCFLFIGCPWCGDVSVFFFFSGSWLNCCRDRHLLRICCQSWSCFLNCKRFLSLSVYIHLLPVCVVYPYLFFCLCPLLNDQIIRALPVRIPGEEMRLRPGTNLWVTEVEVLQFPCHCVFRTKRRRRAGGRAGGGSLDYDEWWIILCCVKFLPEASLKLGKK